MKVFDHQSGKLIRVRETDLYIEEQGNPSGPPLVFLHGGFGDVEDFRSLGALMGDFRMIGIDSRGHGRSALGQEALTYETMQKDVEAVMRELGLEKASVIGFSDGGIVAYRLALHTSLVSKLVTVGSDWRPPDEKLKRMFSSITPESWRKKFPAGVESYLRLNPEPDFGRLVDLTLRLWLDESPSGYPGDRIANLEAEVLLIRGDEDQMMPRTCFADLSRLLPSAKFLNVPFAGHMTHVDQPEIVSKMIRRFLKET